MSYRDPEAPDLPETDPVGPDDLPGSEDDDDGEEYVPLDDEPGAPTEAPVAPSEPQREAPPTPGAFAAPPAR